MWRPTPSSTTWSRTRTAAWTCRRRSRSATSGSRSARPSGRSTSHPTCPPSARPSPGSTSRPLANGSTGWWPSTRWPSPRSCGSAARSPWPAPAWTAPTSPVRPSCRPTSATAATTAPGSATCRRSHGRRWWSSSGTCAPGRSSWSRAWPPPRKGATCQRVLLELGIAGSATAPRAGDYLMPVSVNTGGNKMDAFLRRSIGYQVTLLPDGGAKAVASVTLRNTGPSAGLPRDFVGPYDARFRKGENNQLQTLYVAGGYGFASATVDGRAVRAEAEAELGGLALSQPVDVPARSSVTVAYHLARSDAVEVVDGDHLRYRLLLRPQATAWPDQVQVSVSPPPGWRFGTLPAEFRQSGQAAVWSGPLHREQALALELVRAR